MNKTSQDMNNCLQFTVYGLPFNVYGLKFKVGRRLLLAAAMMLCGMTAQADDYVFMYNNYFVGNGSTPTTSFVPNASVYSGTSGTKTIQNADGYYIAYSSGSSTTQGDFNITIGSNGYVYLTDYTYYYLNMNNPNNNNRAWRISNTTNNRAIAYTVTTEVVKSLSDFTIDGNDVLTSATSYSYTHSNSYYSNYTHYSFNSLNYYSTNPAQAASTTAPAATEVTTGYTWTLEGGSTYASVNTSSGQITVSSLPATDLTMTLTCSVTSGGVTKTASKTVILQSATIAAPTITRTGNNITLATTSVGATIYYTTDGSTPSSSSTAYSGPFSIEALNYPVTVKAIAIRSGNNSTVTTETYSSPACEKPQIRISSTGNVTITCATEGATIRYTTDGTVPTESNGTVFSDAFSVSNLTTVKAIAVKTGYNNSEVATKQYITSGTSGGKVILNDYEDHSWSYYSDASCPIHSLNPADVKITYHGNGTGTVSTTNGATPASNSWTQNATTVQVSNSEADSIFIYYKTLERLDGSSSDNPTGLCEYTTIPNPFSVRPTYQYATGDFNKYCGFYMWRIKDIKNGKIYDANDSQKTKWTSGNVTTANMLYAEGTYYFQPDNEYGMEVELEALWARAYVTTGTTSLSSGNYVTGTNAYERNFHVLTGSTTASNLQKTYDLTISARYPDGTNGGGSLSGGFTAGSDTKFENITISASNGTYNANCHNLVIGRGCSGSTINIVQGLGGDQTSDVSYSIRLESGTIVSFWPTQKTATTFSGKLSTLSTIGCDYDRASGTNTLLHIMPNVSSGTNTYFIEGGGGANTFNGSGNRNNITYDWIVKSGKIQENVSINTADPFYLGNYVSSKDANSVKYIGKRRLIVEGGEMGTVAAGIGPYGTNYSNYTVDDGSWTVLIRLKGGTVNGAIYGAGVYTGSSGDRRFVFTGGTVKGWVAGGCNGTETTGGELYGETFIYVGGKTILDGTAATVGSSNGGHIFGAGSGINGGTTVGRVNSSTVVVADEAEIARNVYGGGNYGYVRDGTGNKSDIYILGGTVKGSVFGGSNQQVGQIVNIKMTGGLVESGVYGGSNASGTVAGPVSVQVLGGTVGEAGIDPETSETGHVFGSGYGQNTSVSGNVEVVIGVKGAAHSDSPLIHGNVYGGGHAAPYTSTSKTFKVTGRNGHVKGSIFGGGKGTSAGVTGPTNVLLEGYIHVDKDVYGGGQLAPVDGSTNVIIQD